MHSVGLGGGGLTRKLLPVAGSVTSNRSVNSDGVAVQLDATGKDFGLLKL